MSNSPVFLDTSGWIAALNQDDEYHSLAAQKMLEFKNMKRGLITTDWILAETGNGLAKKAARTALAVSISQLFQARRSRLLWIQEEILEEALDLYQKTDDKNWGLVDCASFVVMRHEGITEAMTTDRHFEQAGFQRLLNK